MKIADNIIGNILGKPRVRGGKNDWDFDGVPNKKDCQPRNTMRQDNGKCAKGDGNDTYIVYGGVPLCKKHYNEEVTNTFKEAVRRNP